MDKIKFKQEFTFERESVKNFAKFLGWQETITEQQEVLLEGHEFPQIENVEVPNPQTFIQFVEQLAREHTLQFTKAWAENLKQQELRRQTSELIAEIEPVLTEQIIKPVEDSLVSETVELEEQNE